MVKEIRTIDLSSPKRRYYNDECDLTICPECGSPLTEEKCVILLHAKSDTDDGTFMTNLSGSHFCKDCPVVVFDIDKVDQAAEIGIRGSRNLSYYIAGIVDMDSIPDHKKHLEIGSNENPVPLVEFLPDLNTKTSIAPKNPGRNEPCPCGSGKKHKKCCGQKMDKITS